VTKLHTFYWMMTVGALVVLWFGRQARIRSREVRERMERREQEFLTQFPQLADVLDEERRNSR